MEVLPTRVSMGLRSLPLYTRRVPHRSHLNRSTIPGSSSCPTSLCATSSPNSRLNSKTNSSISVRLKLGCPSCPSSSRSMAASSGSINCAFRSARLLIGRPLLLGYLPILSLPDIEMHPAQLKRGTTWLYTRGWLCDRLTEPGPACPVTPSQSPDSHEICFDSPV